MVHKFIHGIDSLLIVGTLVMLLTFIGYSSPLVTAPINKNESNIVFSIPKVNTILLNDEKIIVEDGKEINLNSGTYSLSYEFKGIINTLSLTILDSVTLGFEEHEEKYNLVNKGSSSLQLNISDRKKVLDSRKIIASIFLAYMPGGKNE